MEDCVTTTVKRIFNIPPEVPPWTTNIAVPVCDNDGVWSLLVSDVIEPYEAAGAVPLP